jgi:hypothetical protein
MVFSRRAELFFASGTHALVRVNASRIGQVSAHFGFMSRQLAVLCWTAINPLQLAGPNLQITVQ